METSDVKSEFERVSCYKCPKCEFVSLEEIAITDHLNEQHRDPIRNETQQNVIIFHCLYYIFIKVWLSGFNTKNFIFVIFSKQKPITKKKIRKTIPNGKLKCDIGDCPVSLIQPENIEYHKLCHSPENKFKCPECEEIFSRWKVVLLHLWKCHSIDIELFSCTLCDYKSSKSELLKFHMETHSSERPCLCDLCGKGFKNMKQMRNHRVIPYKFNQFLFKIAWSTRLLNKYSALNLLRVNISIQQRTFNSLFLISTKQFVKSLEISLKVLVNFLLWKLILLLHFLNEFWLFSN